MLSLNFINNIIIKEDFNKHPADENIELVKKLGANTSHNNHLIFPIKNQEDTFAVNWINNNKILNQKLIGFHAGSSTFKNHINKRWSTQKFSKLSILLNKYFNAKILVFGGAEENELIDQIVLQSNNCAIKVLNTTLGQTAALIKNCVLLVSNDTSLMHVAAACNTPSVPIFGPTDWRKGRPYNSPHYIASKYLSCSPCFYYSPKPLSCKWGTFECLQNLSVYDVFNACIELLKKS